MIYNQMVSFEWSIVVLFSSSPPIYQGWEPGNESGQTVLRLHAYIVYHKQINVGGAWGHVTTCACPAHVSSCRSPTGWMEKKLNMLNLHFDNSIFNFCQQVATDSSYKHEIWNIEDQPVLIDNIRYRHQQGHSMHSDWIKVEKLNMLKQHFSKFNF